MNGWNFRPQLPQAQVFESVRQQQPQTGRCVTFLPLALCYGDPDSSALIARIELVQIDRRNGLAALVFQDEAHLLISEQIVVTSDVQLQGGLADGRHLRADPPFVRIVFKRVQKIGIAGLHGSEPVLVILQHGGKDTAQSALWSVKISLVFCA